MSTRISSSELSALIRRAMRGDTQAFEQLITAFSEDIVYNLRLSLDKHNRGEAEDAAQEVVLILYRNIGRLKSPHAFYSYPRTVIYNMARRYNQKEGRALFEDIDEYEQTGRLRADSNEQPEEEFERGQAALRVAACLEKLPQKQHEALFLHYYRDLSYGEIAERLGVSINTVGSNISKGKKTLKKLLEQSGEHARGVTLDVGGGAAAARECAAGAPGSANDGFEEKLGGLAIAPLMNAAFEHTMLQGKVQLSAEQLVAYTQELITMQPDMAVQSAAARLSKYLGAVLVSLAVIALVAFGINALSVDIQPEAGSPEVFLPGATIVLSQDIDDSAEDNSLARQLDPNTAQVFTQEGIAGAWRIVDEASGEQVSAGALPPASLEGLTTGEYRISFEVSSPDGRGQATVERIFTIE